MEYIMGALIFSTSFVRNISHCRNNWAAATIGKILGNFSPIVPPSAAGVRSRRFRRGGHLVAGVGNVLITGPPSWGVWRAAGNGTL